MVENAQKLEPQKRKANRRLFLLLLLFVLLLWGSTFFVRLSYVKGLME